MNYEFEYTFLICDTLVLLLFASPKPSCPDIHQFKLGLPKYFRQIFTAKLSDAEK